MELRHLRYFLAVADVGSLSLAAEHRLHTSQPSLSRQIRDLEGQVGTALFVRGPRGVALTDAGRAFREHARLALHQVDSAIEAARRAGLRSKHRFALGFLTGHEITWLSKAMQVLQPDLANLDVTVTSDYSPDLAEAVARGSLDLAFMRAEPHFDLVYRVVQRDPLIALLPSDHRLASKKKIRAKDLISEPYIAMGLKAGVLRGRINEYLADAGVDLVAAQEVDNPAMVMSLVASTRGIAIAPAYLENLMPGSVVSRSLAGPTPFLELVAGYHASNPSSYLRSFLEGLVPALNE